MTAFITQQVVRFGDTPIVRVTCFRLGGASLGLRYVYTVQERVCLDARMVTVCVNMDTLKSLPIPDRYRSRFEAIREAIPESARRREHHADQ